MKSLFENVPDKIIFKFVKMMMEDFEFNELETSQDSELFDAIESVGSYFGIRGEDSVIDADYFYNLWKLNVDLFEEDKLTSNLNRPNLKNVSFDWHAWETNWVKSTYRHEIETYSTGKEDIYNYIGGLNSESDLFYYDGNEINHEVIDTDTTDDSVDIDSFEITE